MQQDSLDDILDRLVAEYHDRVQAGTPAPRQDLLERVPSEQRAELERCLRMIDLGLASAPSGLRPLAPGLVLERYQIERELGRGGMAHVFLARDLELARPVALKVLRPGLALEQRHVDRFRREALAVARLAHPHLVRVFGVGAAHGYHWLALEYVDGPTLARVLERLSRERAPSAQDLARAADIPALAELGATFEQALCALLAPLAHALAAAHALGIVHRDIKPANILIQRDGRAVLADFGLAKEDGNPALSLTGDALGTPSYMSPEQASAARARVDHRTDVYSLGVTLYEALAGRRPFEGDSVLAVIDAIRTRTPPALRSVAPACTQSAESVVRRAMEREPGRRYSSAALLAADLEALAEGRRSRADVEAGGALRRCAGQLALMSSGEPYEYRSARTFLGWPLVHVHLGRRAPGCGPRVAKGWLALAHIAIGGLAIGNVAIGGIAIAGAVSLGGLTFAGALGLGLLVGLAGGAASGLVAVAGGLAAGGFALAGGMGLGWAAVGGCARGHYALGGEAVGEHVISPGARDPAAVAFFSEWLPFLGHLYE